MLKNYFLNGIFIIISSRYKPSLLAIGAAVLLITFCNLSLTGLIVRNSDETRSSLLENCPGKMMLASEEHLKEWQCSSKYLMTEGELNLDCKEEWMVEAWVKIFN